MRLYLTGFMGAGKSAVGGIVAKDLSCPFLDLDQLVEDRAGVSVKEIFARQGESAFRDLEHESLKATGRYDDIVVATGGGVVMRPANRTALGGRGLVIYLHATVAQQLSRTNRDRQRPLLQTGDPEQTLRELMKVRDPLYREIADYVVDTDELSARTVAHQISQTLAAT
jgi:shikimate kinase